MGAAAARVRDHDGTPREREASWRLPELVVGGVELAQKISMTGALSTNITSLATLTSGGELTVNAQYTIVP